MNAFPSDRRRSKLPILIVLLVIVIAAIAGGTYFLAPRFESEPPQITVSPTSTRWAWHRSRSRSPTGAPA